MIKFFFGAFSRKRVKHRPEPLGNNCYQEVLPFYPYPTLISHLRLRYLLLLERLLSKFLSKTFVKCLSSPSAISSVEDVALFPSVSFAGNNESKASGQHLDLRACIFPVEKKAAKKHISTLERGSNPSEANPASGGFYHQVSILEFLTKC